MTHTQLMIAVRQVIIAGLTFRGYEGWNVIQGYQVDQIAVSNTPTIHYHHISDQLVGWAQRSEYWDENKGKVVRIERQRMITRVQIDITLPKSYADELHVVDIAREVRFALQSTAAIELMKGHRMSTFRIADIRSPYYLNDSPGYTARPSFDVLFQHFQQWESEIDPLSGLETQNTVINGEVKL